jgi:dihydrolipoamide dehydrogenase
MPRYDLLVIGSGPGGYVAAIRGAQLGLKTACVEKEYLGGVCLNVGCIPSKALLESAKLVKSLKGMGRFGIKVGKPEIDFAKVVARSRGVADRSEKGVRHLFKKYGVELIEGTARVQAPGRVSVGDEVYEAEHVIVATGAHAMTVPGIEPDGQAILTYKEAIVRDRKPASAVVLGGGAIGLEFAWFWASMGVKVTIVEGMDRLAPLADADCSAELARGFRRGRIKVITGVFCDRVERAGDGTRVVLKDGQSLEAEVTLIALGTRPSTSGLGLEELGVELERGFIQTDAACRTSVQGLYAIGDCAGPPMLAHKASKEALICVETIAGESPAPLDPLGIPFGIFCQPQIASVGRTEQELIDAGVAYRKGSFPFSANGKSRATNHTEGFVKILLDEEHGELLGAHIVGADAVELLAELVLFRSAELDAETFLDAVHGHPTAGETVMEAVAAALGVCVHM